MSKAKKGSGDDVTIISAVDDKRKRAETKALDISLNELGDMYQSGELNITPEYQRLFRWSIGKQSQFIESLILEMPIPPIFVIELEEGKWELIDGLQRISTYLHFRGMLDAPNIDPKIEPGDKFALTDCDIIQELNGRHYDQMPTALQIRLKRSFLRVERVRKETDKRFRYYMFKRLNTGGEPLSEQEVRNCTIRLLGDKFNNFIQELSGNSDFQKCIEPLSEESRRQMGDVELVLRFFSFKNNFSEFKHDVSDFMSNYMERVTDTSATEHIVFPYESERKLFEETFHLLRKTLAQDTCLRWMGTEFGGQFLMQHFEAITLGTVSIISKVNLSNPAEIRRLKTALENIKKAPEFKTLTTGGGKNSPGPYREKINFVKQHLRSVL